MMIVLYAMLILLVDVVKNKRLINIPVVISIISFHIYGIFQSMQYIPMIWSLIFLNLGYAMTIDDKVLPDRVRRAAGWVVKVMVVVVLCGGVVYFMGRGSQDLADRYGLKVYAQEQDWHDYSGFYHREKWAEGFYRWSGGKGSVVISGQGSVVSGQIRRLRRLEGLTEEGTDGKDGMIRMGGGLDERDGWMNGGLVEFDFVCGTPGVEKEPVRLMVSLDGKRIDEIVFNSKVSKIRWYFVGDGRNEFLFDVSRTWNPRKLGISDDRRDLGVAVGVE